MCGLRRWWAGDGFGDRERDRWGYVRGGGRGVAPTHVFKRFGRLDLHRRHQRVACRRYQIGSRY